MQYISISKKFCMKVIQILLLIIFHNIFPEYIAVFIALITKLSDCAGHIHMYPPWNHKMSDFLQLNNIFPLSLSLKYH